MALPTPEEIAWMQENIDDTLVPDMIACASVCGVASLVFVALRYVSRRISGAGLQLSDWLIFVAWLLFAVFDVCFAMLVLYGGGRHAILVTDPRMLQIINVVNENLYMFAMAFIKFSILAMYAYIFPQPVFRWCIIATAVFVSMWAISAALVSTFQCLPIEFGWDPSIPGGSCINYGLVVLSAGIVNIITDFVILAMPIPLVLRLNMSTQKKRLLILTFAMGGSACIVSIIRLAYALNVGTTSDASWDSIPAGMLSVVELTVGILAASLPVYRPLYRRVRNKDTLREKSDSHSNGHTSLPPGSNTWRSVNVTTEPSMTGQASEGITITDYLEMSTYNRKGDKWIRVDDENEPY